MSIAKQLSKYINKPNILLTLTANNIILNKSFKQ